MSEFQRLLRKNEHNRCAVQSAVVALVVTLLAAGAGFYFGATERGQTLWEEYFGPKLVWHHPIDPAELEQQFPGAILAGRVVKVVDGDTVHIRLSTKEKFRVRLSDIDAPESCQPYGDKSTALLRKLVRNKNVRVVLVDADHYGRLVARLYTDKIDVSAQMVGEGGAWFYPKYAHDESLFYVEEEARDGKRGLWTLPLDQRIEPWEFRKKYECKGRKKTLRVRQSS